MKTKSIQSKYKFIGRDTNAIGFMVAKRGAEPEVERLLTGDEKGFVTDTRNTGYADQLVRETFIEFPLTQKILDAEHIELRFRVENESALAGSVGHYRGTGSNNPRQFGASTLLKRFESRNGFIEIDATSIVKQYAKEGADFIGFRFYGSEGASVSSKQFYVCGANLVPSNSGMFESIKNYFSSSLTKRAATEDTALLTTTHSSTTSWRNWGDHPIIVAIVVICAIVAALPTIWGWLKPAPSIVSPVTTTTQNIPLNNGQQVNIGVMNGGIVNATQQQVGTKMNAKENIGAR